MVGSAKMNIEMVQDYTTKEYFIRLHREIKLNSKDVVMIKEFIESKDWEKAATLLKKTAPRETHALIDLFWTDIFRADQRKAK